MDIFANHREIFSLYGKIISIEQIAYLHMMAQRAHLEDSIYREPGNASISDKLYRVYRQDYAQYWKEAHTVRQKASVLYGNTSTGQCSYTSWTDLIRQAKLSVASKWKL